jgi:hypothetical protein
MTFEEARQSKFDKGRREHGETWDAEHIDAVKEMQDELLDLANYSTLLNNQLGRLVFQTVKAFWLALEESASR